MIEVKRYDKSYKNNWDEFCKASLNGVFLFYRDYMDYHSDRFNDHSLMFYRGNKIIALLPCNEKIEKKDSLAPVKILSSHDGLTFGTFIIGKHTHQIDMLDCVTALIDYCREKEIAEVYFKPVPVLLQQFPSEQDVYALMKNDANLLISKPSTITVIKDYTPDYGEKGKCKKAMNEGLQFRLCDNDAEWEEYHVLLTYVLGKYHGVKPVHNLSELLKLHNIFKENMKLFAVFNGNKMLAGSVVYEYNRAVHTQYMASNEEGRRKGALHFCIQNIIDYYKDKEWIDFGTSTEKDGKVLNAGLITFKEGFKGNTLLYNQWRLEIKNEDIKW